MQEQGLVQEQEQGLVQEQEQGLVQEPGQELEVVVYHCYHYHYCPSHHLMSHYFF